MKNGSIFSRLSTKRLASHPLCVDARLIIRTINNGIDTSAMLPRSAVKVSKSFLPSRKKTKTANILTITG